MVKSTSTRRSLPAVSIKRRASHISRNVGRKSLIPSDIVDKSLHDDRIQVQKVLHDTEMVKELTRAWRCCIYSGEGMFSDPPRVFARRYRMWLREIKIIGYPILQNDDHWAEPTGVIPGTLPGYVPTPEEGTLEDKLLVCFSKIAHSEHSALSRHKDLFKTGECIVGEVAFIRLLQHMSLLIYPVSSNKQHHLSFRNLFTRYLQPYSNWIHIVNDTWTGFGIAPDVCMKSLKNLPDVDRTLFVFDKVITNMTLDYQSRSTHGIEGGWGGTQHQTDESVIEIEELRRFMQSVRIFPTKIAWSDIIALASACNGYLVTSPTVVLGLPSSSIPPSTVTTPRSDASRNKLILPALGTDVSQNGVTGTHVQRVDPAHTFLTRKTFIEFCIRVSQKVFGKQSSPYGCIKTPVEDLLFNSLPSLGSRLEAFFMTWQWDYQKVTRRCMELDLTIPKGVPDFLEISPEQVVVNKPVTLIIKGCNFCTRRGMYIRFSGHDTIKVGIENISVNGKVCEILLENGLPVDPKTDIIVKSLAANGMSVITTCRKQTYIVEGSNDGFDFTDGDTHSSVSITVEEKFPPFIVDPGVQSELHKIFLTYTKMSGGYNVTHLDLRAWTKFKTDYGLQEDSEQHSNGLPEYKNSNFFIKKGTVMPSQDESGLAVFVATFSVFQELLAKVFFYMGFSPGMAFYSLVSEGYEWLKLYSYSTDMIEVTAAIAVLTSTAAGIERVSTLPAVTAAIIIATVAVLDPR